MPNERTISVTDFKAKCLSLFDDLADRRIDRVVVTRRGEAVAELVPPTRKLPSAYGAHRGSVLIAEGVDLTEPVVPADAFDVLAETER